MHKSIALIASLGMSFFAQSTLAQTSVGSTISEAGISACKGVTEELSKFLVKGEPEASHLFWNTAQKNTRSTSGLIVKQYSDGASHITLTMNPEGNVCDWHYTETFYTTDDCVAFRETALSDAEYRSMLKNAAVYKLGSVHYYLSAAPSGCLVTKREGRYGQADE